MIIRTAYNNQEWAGKCIDAVNDTKLFQCQKSIVETVFEVNKKGTCKGGCYESVLCKDYKWIRNTGDFGERAEGKVFFIYTDTNGKLVLWGRTSITSRKEGTLNLKKFKPLKSEERICNITYDLLESFGVPKWGNGTYRYINDETSMKLDRLIDSGKYYFDDPIEPFLDKEGKKILRVHLKAERSSKLVKKFKEGLTDFSCSICKFDFKEKYGIVGEGFIEAHHKIPLSEKKTYVSSIDDLIPVCSNCHRMLHRTKPAMSPSKLKKIINR